MFLGKPDRLQGILFDIENFIGLKNFTIYLFAFGLILIVLEASWLLVKKKKRKLLSNLLLPLFFVPLFLFISSQDIFYKNDKVMPIQVNHSTLLLATEGSIYNFDMDNYKLSWQYDSSFDTSGNRTSFVI